MNVLLECRAPIQSLAATKGLGIGYLLPAEIVLLDARSALPAAT